MRLRSFRLGFGVTNVLKTCHLIVNVVILRIFYVKQKKSMCRFHRSVSWFLGNKKADNYQEIIQEFLFAYKVLKFNMFLDSHLRFLPWKSRYRIK